jgi:hypothetical protein
VPALRLLVFLYAASPLWEVLQTQPDQTVRLPWSAGARARLQDHGALDAVMIGVRKTVVMDRQARTQHLFDHHGQSRHNLVKDLLQRLSDEFRHRVTSPRRQPWGDVDNDRPLIGMDGEEQFRGQRYG